MKKINFIIGFIIIGVFLIGCTSTKLYYHETDASTKKENSSIICLVDNLGGVMSIVTIDGKKADLGGSFNANKSVVIKPGSYSIVLNFINSANRENFLFKPIELKLSPGQFYFVMPRNKTVYTSTVWYPYQNRFDKEIEIKDFWLEIYQMDKLDSYGLSTMDVNHLTKIYQNVLKELK